MHGNWIVDNILNKRYLLPSTKYCPFYRGMDKKKKLVPVKYDSLIDRSVCKKKERVNSD